MPDADKPTLLLIDGHSLAFRAFYALPVDSFVTRDGQHTNAIHGFIAMLLNLLQAEKPTHLAVAFDISRFSFRTRDYPEYKGTRAITPLSAYIARSTVKPSYAWAACPDASEGMVTSGLAVAREHALLRAAAADEALSDSAFRDVYRGFLRRRQADL